jgi:septum formation inhibitor-activating ATPase MinD
VLDIFDGLREPVGLSNKVMFVINRMVNEKEKGRGTIPAASIENHLKKQIVCTIPLDERSVLTAVNQGVPLVAKQRSRSPGRELAELAELVRQSVEASDSFRAQMMQDLERSTTTKTRKPLFGGN